MSEETTRPKKKKKWLLIIIVVIAIIGISSLGGGASSTPPAVSAAENEAKSMSAETLKSQCKTITYDELKRNPSSYQGELIKITANIVQKVSDKQWRVYTHDSDQWNFSGYNSDEEFYIFDNRSNGTNIIEDDVVAIYGVYRGTVDVKRALTNTTDEVPSISAYVAELSK